MFKDFLIGSPLDILNGFMPDEAFEADIAAVYDASAIIYDGHEVRELVFIEDQAYGDDEGWVLRDKPPYLLPDADGDVFAAFAGEWALAKARKAVEIAERELVRLEARLQA